MAKTSLSQNISVENLPTGKVIYSVAAAEGVDPLDLSQPLSEVIDTDALDSLFQHGDFDGRVEFTYQGYQILVEGDGQVSITERQT